MSWFALTQTSTNTGYGVSKHNARKPKSLIVDKGTHTHSSLLTKDWTIYKKRFEASNNDDFIVSVFGQPTFL